MFWGPNSKVDTPETRNMGRQDHRHFPCKKSKARKTVQMSHVSEAPICEAKEQGLRQSLWFCLCFGLACVLI